MNFKNLRNITNPSLLLSACLILLFVACNNNNRYKPASTSNAKPIAIKVERFDKDLFSINTSKPDSDLALLAKKYGVFYYSYANDVMMMPLLDGDSLFLKPMRMLLSIKRMQELAKIVDSNFSDMTDIESQLSKAMGVYCSEFKQQKPPRFVSFISEFANGNIIYDNMICIGLDFYMNKRLIDFYRGLEFPEFMISKMQSNYIVPNALKAMAIGLTDNQTSADKRFIAQMIVEGKVRYFMKYLLPETADTIIMGYTKNQLVWCENNEAEIWTHFIEKNMLYESNPGKFMRYLNDGPFTVAEDVPKESSPAIGSYTGWQIVNAYMHQNPQISLKQLMQETNFEMILKKSKYKPN